MSHRFSSWEAPPPARRREEIRRGMRRPAGFSRGKAPSPTPPQGRKTAGERDVLPRKLFTGGKRGRPPAAGEKSAGVRACCPASYLPGGSTAARPSQGRNPAGERACCPASYSPGEVPPPARRRGEIPQGREDSKKPRRWAGLSGWFGIMRSFGAGHALPEQPRTSCILWRTSSRMWSRAGVRY